MQWANKGTMIPKLCQAYTCTTHKWRWNNNVATYKLMNKMQQWAQTCIYPLPINLSLMRLLLNLRSWFAEGLAFKEAGLNLVFIYGSRIFFLLALKALLPKSYLVNFVQKYIFNFFLPILLTEYFLNDILNSYFSQCSLLSLNSFHEPYLIKIHYIL